MYPYLLLLLFFFCQLLRTLSTWWHIFRAEIGSFPESCFKFIPKVGEEDILIVHYFFLVWIKLKCTDILLVVSGTNGFVNYWTKAWWQQIQKLKWGENDCWVMHLCKSAAKVYESGWIGKNLICSSKWMICSSCICSSRQTWSWCLRTV